MSSSHPPPCLFSLKETTTTTAAIVEQPKKTIGFAYFSPTVKKTFSSNDPVVVDILRYTAYGNLEKVLQILKRDSTYANAEDDFCQTPLHIACSCERLEIVKLLLFYRANVHSKSFDGFDTPLHSVFWNPKCTSLENDDQKRIVAQLIKRGANPYLLNSEGKTVVELMFAKGWLFVDISELLVNIGGKFLL